MDDTLRYLASMHPATNPLLLELEQHGTKDGIPIITRQTGRLLSVLVHMMQANRILEIGTGYGYSTLWMALAQPPVGKIWTIDPNVEGTEIAMTYFKRAGEDEHITIFNQTAFELLENFQQRNLDIVFIDGDKQQYRGLLDLTIPMLKRSGIIVVDDMLLAGQEFNEYFLSRQDLDATILPLGDGLGIGAKIE